MAGGYDISTSISVAQHPQATNASPFSVTGGGGSSLSSAIDQAGRDLTANSAQTPAVKNPWITYAIIGAVGIAAIFLWRRK